MRREEIGRKKTGTNKIFKCLCSRQQQLNKFKNQMLMSKTAAIESNSNPQFVIEAFKLLNEKTLSRTTAFAQNISLDISLIEKLNSSFFFSSKTLIRSKTLWYYTSSFCDLTLQNIKAIIDKIHYNIVKR